MTERSRSVFGAPVAPSRQRPLRVAVVSSFYPAIAGGAEAGLKVLIHALRDSLVDLQVYSLNAPESPEAGVTGIARVRKQLTIAGLAALDSIVANRLTAALRQRPPDVIHVNDTYAFMACRWVADTLRLPLILSYHNNVGVPHASFGAWPPVGLWLDRRERRVLKALMSGTTQCFVIADSRYVAKRLIERGIAGDRVTPVYIDGIIDHWGRAPLPESSELRIVAAGRVHAHKGFEDLIRAVALLISNGRRVRLEIAGDGPHLNALRSLVASAGVEQCVTFHGAVELRRVLDLFDRGHVVVVPTRTPEPFGRVAVEAMSRGRPVVAGAVGGLPEIVAHDQTGFLVPPGNSQELAGVIDRFVDDTTLAQRLGERALERAKSMFSATRIAGDVTDVYDRVAGRHRSEARRETAG